MKWVLRHELYHCDNGDMLGRWVFLVVQAMHWFNPLMYWLIDQLEWSTELECDAKVVDGADLQARKAYSMAILNSIREGNRKRARLSTGFCGEPKNTGKKIGGDCGYAAKEERTNDVFFGNSSGDILFYLCGLYACGIAADHRSRADGFDTGIV